MTKQIEAVQAEIKEKSKEARRQIGELLTAEQLATLKKMRLPEAAGPTGNVSPGWRQNGTQR